LSPRNVFTAQSVTVRRCGKPLPLIRAYSTDRDQIVLTGHSRARLVYHDSNALVRHCLRCSLWKNAGRKKKPAWSGP
jgi:D-alanyl-D-alanine endopeptidase (penicillin-binding protein 7)